MSSRLILGAAPRTSSSVAGRAGKQRPQTGTARLTALCLLMSCLLVPEAKAGFEEYGLKAVYIERITRFLTWPKAVSEEQTTIPFVIGILGENPFGTALHELYADRHIKKRPIKVRELTSLEGANQCHILFICRSEEERLAEILKVTRGKPILTIGDTAGFAELGVLVNLVLEGEKLRFVINEAAFHNAGIIVDSLMLKVARIVEPLERTK
jgi:hypothetical protein